MNKIFFAIWLLGSFVLVPILFFRWLKARNRFRKALKEFEEEINRSRKDSQIIVRPLYYQPDGTPYPGPMAWRKWARDLERLGEKRRLGYDKLDNGIEISTVWLGLDYSLTGDKPLIFETMAFAPAKKTLRLGNKTRTFLHDEIDVARYSTAVEARHGHTLMVNKYKHLKSIAQIMDS